ncbi:M20 metallopeptidase family protein [Tessaracoccus flavus]|uniref:Amidohydrolase n=1 Tax=Tessaracoccus flavus TaxID=1610493 RepID=A0A1Q2CBP7_9ACTN|nr:M20 family metallopeptidase [Tessaracoccus flavus]AQP43528.1 amidohydrolase [Tessaracoccus flavus]SDY86172.1 hippurate hydrolase [Tessaracoccus flavus]
MIDLIAVRRELHQIPEVGLDLPRTQEAVLKALDGLPLEITLGESLTSVVGVLRGGRETQGKRPVVLLRADMDALPVKELTGLDYASTNGNMHACGHDLHMTMLIGAAHELCARRGELAGDVIFMFQPGEEGVDGARYMLEEGLLDVAGPRPDYVYAIHVWSALDPHGVFSTKPGTVMASSDIAKVRVLGRGGHGSTPQLAADPVPALAAITTGLNTMVTRNFDVQNPVVVTVGLLSAGTIANVIPEEGRLEATLRTFDTDVRAKLFQTIERLVDGIAAGHGVTGETEFVEQYPVTVNHDAEADVVADVVRDLFGDERHRRWEKPLAGAEDFSRLLEEVPGCFIGLSACPPDADPDTAPFNHSAYARFDDAVVPDGARLFAELALRKLTP